MRGVIAGLREAIENATIAPDSDELTEVLALCDLLDARVSAALGEFDSAGLWDLDGRVSLRDWIRVHARTTTLAAAQRARVATRVRDLPGTAAGWESGALSSGQVHVVAGPLNDRRRPAFAETETLNIASINTLDVAGTEVFMRAWAEAFDNANPGRVRDEPDNWLHHSKSLDDRGELHGSLEPVNAALLDTALAVAETRDDPTSPRLGSQRRADALMDIVRDFLANHDKPRRVRHTPHVSLLVTPEQLANGTAGMTLDGRVIPAPDTSALTCDCTIRRIVTADGEILEAGRSVHTVPAALRDVTVARDRHCRWPDCDRPPNWCDAHHLTPWHHGGNTDITNLALLCRRHHTRIHHPNWHAKLLPDATLHITTPTGRTLTSRPPKPGPLP
ncbi:MAG: DUF222 domain-containing protein [Acidimicrobiales bacterium]